MRILQVCNKIPYPLKDGGAIAIHHLSKGFINAGNSVDLLVMNTSRHRTDRETVRTYYDKMGAGIVELVDINTEIRFIKAVINLLFSRLPYNASRFISKSFGEKLEDLLSGNDYDLVQFEGLYLMPYMRIVRKYSDARIAFRAHNVEHEIWHESSLGMTGLLKKIYLRILARRIEKFEYHYINSYDYLIPISDRDALKFKMMGNTKPCFVCPFGFDFDTMPVNQVPPKERNLFYIGSLDWLPNQEGLVWFIKNVWKEIMAVHPGLKFYVAGRNAPGWLASLSRQYNVEFLGEVADAFSFMSDKALMVVPLFSGSGMRVKIVEAMAAGKVVISTAKGAEGIGLKDGNDIIIADDTEAFISAVGKMQSDENEYLQITKNAIRFVREKLNNDSISSRLSEFYKSQLK